MAVCHWQLKLNAYIQNKLTLSINNDLFYRNDPNNKKSVKKTTVPNTCGDEKEILDKSLDIADTSNVENEHNPVEKTALGKNKSTMATAKPRFDYNSLPLCGQTMFNERLNESTSPEGFTGIFDAPRARGVLHDYMGGSMISENASMPKHYSSHPEDQIDLIRQDTKKYMDSLFTG